MKKIIQLSAGMMLFLFAFSSYGVAEENDVMKITARSTKYYKGDPNSDPNTEKGLSATKIPLQKATPEKIGVVAADKNIVPLGSLVFCPQTELLYLQADTGGAVVSRKASKLMGSNKPVFDFYAPEEILPTHFNTFVVVKYDGKLPFVKLYEEYQKKRLNPQYWLARLERLNDDEKEKPEIKKLAKVLRRMDSRRNS